MFRQNSDYGSPLAPSLLALTPGALNSAIDVAETILQAFSMRLESVSADWLTHVGLDVGGAEALARKLAGVGAETC